MSQLSEITFQKLERPERGNQRNAETPSITEDWQGRPLIPVKGKPNMLPMVEVAGRPYKRVFIYILVDPETDQVRYVGKTEQKPNYRLSAHMRENSQCHRCHWLNKLKAKGLRPRMEILEEIVSNDEEVWKAAERFWIAYLLSLDARLTNNTSGGDGVPDLPPETRERVRRASIGRKLTPEQREKAIRNRNYGPASSETRAKMSKAHKGRKITWIPQIAAANRKLSERDVEEITHRLALGEKNKDLSKEYGVHRTTLSKIKTGKYFVH